MKAIFLGNHTVGVRTLRMLHRHTEVAGVVAHPEDPEDGVRYESVDAAARGLGLPTIRATGKSAALENFIRECAPDLIWIADFRYLLPRAVLDLAPLGAINLHPSLLPAYRGRAPVNWAILHGETRLGLTAHFVDEAMDSGDIVGQRAFTLDRDQDVGDALNLLYPLYESITAEVLADFLRGTVVRRAQDAARATAFPRRTPADGRIDWNAPAMHTWNLIRAVAAPYPGAFTPWGGGMLRLWRASEIKPFETHVSPAPGEVLAVSTDGRRLEIACRDASLVVTKFALEGAAEAPVVADRLGAVEVPAALVA